MAVFCDGHVLGVQDRMLLQYKNHYGYGYIDKNYTLGHIKKKS